jgi:drug/metabolite transporter (DMT)-like permease
MLPALFIFPFKINILNFSNITYLLNILYLGLGASAICFVTWNKAIKILGAVKTSTYIYIVPVVTIITSFIVLKEKITIIALVGALLTLAGLFISENKIK